jgi:serine/threonine-protein kinase
MNLDTGSIVGDYQIIGVLGEGGMGKVFKVRNTISDRIEAMKVLLPDLAGQPELADRFLQEIKVLASLDHSNIAALRTAVRFENQLLMIMELVEGISLDQRLRQGRLPVDEAVRCISDVLSALAYAHAHGVIHRDIKPANMMEAPDGSVKLMDFGIAKSVDRKLTQTGVTMGSLYYMSPEQITGAGAPDARSDLYSVGVSLYELITGRRPFDGDSQFAIMSAHLKTTPPPPITIDPSLPSALNDLILLAVKREPGERFQTAEAFRNALNSVLKGTEPTVVMPLPMDAQATVAQAPAKGHRALWATAGALCFAGVLAAGIMMWPSKKTVAQSELLPEKPAVEATVPAPSPSPEPPASASQPVQSAAPAQAPISAEPVQAPPKQVAKVEKQILRPLVEVPVKATAQPATVNTPGAPAVSAPAPVPPPPQPDLAAKRAVMQKTRESYAMLNARAVSIHSTLQSLERSQAASGLGLRSDWVQSASLIDSFLRGSHEAIEAGDPESARDLMDKAERQVEKLEKALNK